jgi:hypothetical protein
MTAARYRLQHHTDTGLSVLRDTETGEVWSAALGDLLLSEAVPLGADHLLARSVVIAYRMSLEYDDVDHPGDAALAVAREILGS